MESLITFEEGNNPSTTCSCNFCDKPADFILGSIQPITKTFDNKYPFMGIYLCKDHFKKMNAFLNGTDKIDEIKTYSHIKKQYKKPTKINLRRD